MFLISLCELSVLICFCHLVPPFSVKWLIRLLIHVAEIALTKFALPKKSSAHPQKTYNNNQLVTQDPIIAPQAGGIDDSAATAVEPPAAAVGGQAAAARVLRGRHHARGTATVVSHHGTQDRPTRRCLATPQAAQRG